MKNIQQLWSECVNGLPLDLFALPEVIARALPKSPDDYDYRVYLRESLAQTDVSDVGERTVYNQCVEAWSEQLGSFDWTATWFKDCALKIESVLSWEEQKRTVQSLQYELQRA